MTSNIETSNIEASNIDRKDPGASRYIPFARKYRPSDFSELLGQEVLVKTLNHCIAEERIACAYLLTGIRGVGKTSTARIIAKTLNCTHRAVKDGFQVPCKECKNCQGIETFAHPDVIEIDAASHTSVDDVRSVIESSEYKPLLGKYKIFIIDEVHMLSKNAFNALLKIVEEPPSHVVFIFATTEVRKIPLTIISRCQRFDLCRFSFSEIHQMLAEIAIKEKVQVTDEALKVIAIKSEGSARDATAILDQAVSFEMNHGDAEGKIDNGPDNSREITTREITLPIINNMLGLVESSSLLLMVQYIVANDAQKALELLQDVYIKTVSLEAYIASLADFTAELNKQKIIIGYHNPLFANMSGEITDLLIGLSPARLSLLWQIFAKATQEIKHAHNELLAAEMAIIKAICASNMPAIDKILSAEEALEAGCNGAYGNEQFHGQNMQNVQDIQDTQNVQNVQNVQDVIAGSIKEETKRSTKVGEGPDEGIFPFLRYCHGHNELDIYYTLLNEVEIKEFTADSLELYGTVRKEQLEKIKELLSGWAGKEYKLHIISVNEITSLKEKMLEAVRQSEDFNVIKNKFPQANISDILLAK